MTEQQRERLAAAIREEMKMQGMSQKELAKKAGTSSGQLSNALSGNGSMSPTKWQMACEALGIDYAAVMQQSEEGQSISQAAPVLEKVLEERDKTIAQMEAALKGAAEENQELWHENTKLREERKQMATELVQLKTELDTLKESQSEMIRQTELRVAEEYREAQNLTLLKLKAYFFDREHPDLNL